MTSYRKKLFLVLLVMIGLTLPGSMVQAAKYSGETFSLGAGARGLALGGATIAGPFDGTAAYWNPAGMNYLDERIFTAMHAETFGGLLNHDVLAYTNSRPSGRVESFGFYLYYLGGGDVKITDLDPAGRPYVVREESHGDWLVAAAAAGKLGSRIDYGLSGKLIYRDFAVESGYGLSVDAGLLYQAHRNVRLGLTITDITTGFIKYARTTESIYPTVKPGLLLEYHYDDWTGRAMASGDIKFENIKLGAQYWSGPLSLDTHYGWEIDWQGMLFGRAGVDIGRFTAGLGLVLNKISLDVAYSDHDAFDHTYRVSAGYQF